MRRDVKTKVARPLRFMTRTCIFLLLILPLAAASPDCGRDTPYVGLAPGWAGLHQVNFGLRDDEPTGIRLLNLSVGPAMTSRSARDVHVPHPHHVTPLLSLFALASCPPLAA